MENKKYFFFTCVKYLESQLPVAVSKTVNEFSLLRMCISWIVWNNFIVWLRKLNFITRMSEPCSGLNLNYVSHWTLYCEGGIFALHYNNCKVPYRSVPLGVFCLCINRCMRSTSATFQRSILDRSIKDDCFHLISAQHSSWQQAESSFKS